MQKLERVWDWLLPGLISLSPMGAIAYYNAVAEEEAPQPEPAGVGRRALLSDELRGPVLIPLARL